MFARFPALRRVDRRRPTITDAATDWRKLDGISGLPRFLPGFPLDGDNPGAGPVSSSPRLRTGTRQISAVRSRRRPRMPC